MRRNIPPLYALLFIGLLFTGSYFYEKYRKQQKEKETEMLLKNAAFTQSRFTGEIETSKRSPNTPFYVYEYEVAGNKYYVKKPKHRLQKPIDQLGDRFYITVFPVVYDSMKPEVGRMLVSTYEFNELHLPLPAKSEWMK